MKLEVFRKKSFAEKLQKMAEAQKKVKTKTKTKTKGLDEEEKVSAIINCKNPKEFAKKLEKEHPQVKVKFIYDIIDAIAVETTASEILETISPMNDVEIIDEDLEVHIMLNESVPLLKVPEIWGNPNGNRGEGVTVAVVDTGIDDTHADLNGKVLLKEDFTDEKGTGMENIDGNGHGTHVASTIAGKGAVIRGKYKGVATKAKLIAAKVLASNGSGSFSGVIAGIDWAAKQDCQVMNLSLGANVSGSCDGTDAVCQAVDAAMDKGIVMCIAAGNAGPESSTVGTPGCAKKVITVGATDKNDGIAWFSSRGPTKDNRVKPDVCFPGVNIVAARAKKTSMGTPVDDHYTSASGTSMATPHCAGVAALLKAANPDLTSHRIKTIIMNSAIDLNLDPNTQGKGRCDAFVAFEKAVSGEPPEEEPPEEEPP
ncbi:MAG: S8 family serine peptidase, partial [Candidatus Lokiarchaeota archaeon]|nr:S8 family serine peptidase [Candidatus Lokiarchaeota archaeon]